MARHRIRRSARPTRLAAIAAASALVAAAVVAIPQLSEATSPDTWATVAPGVTGQAEFDAISCVSDDWCMAVGGAAADEWNGTIWTPVSTVPAQGNNGGLESVSCTSPTFCIAVGIGPTRNAIIESWDGTSWSLASNPNPATDSNNLYGVSCTSPEFCVAVGFQQYTSDIQAEPGLIEMWNGAAWTLATSDDQFPSGADALNSVSCTSPNFCVAVGNGGTTSSVGMGESWNGAAWSAISLPSQTTVTDFAGVSCPSTNSCTAIGMSFSTGATSPLVDQWNGVSWSSQILPSDGFPLESPSGISCFAPEQCVAVGMQHASTSAGQTMVLDDDANTWSAVTSPDPGGTDNSLAGVSCVTLDTCASVGFAVAADNNVYPTIISDYQRTSATVSPILALSETAPVVVNSSHGGTMAVTYPTPTATLNGAADPTASVKCSPASGSQFNVGMTTTVTCNADDPVAANNPVSAQIPVTVSGGPMTKLGIRVTPTSIRLGQSVTLSATGYDQYGDSMGDVTAATTFTGPGCVGTTCTPTAAGTFTITGTDGSVTGTTTLDVDPIPVPVDVTGIVVGNKTVLFSGTATLPNGQFVVVQGVNCPVINVDGGELVTPSLAYGSYPLAPSPCSIDQFTGPGLSNYVADANAGTITSAKFGVTTASIPNGRVKAAYSAKLNASGGTTYKWSLVSGALPPGVKLSTAGALSGTPTTAGTYPFVVQVQSGTSVMTWPYSITISATTVVPLEISASWLPVGNAGKYYSQTLGSTGGSGTKHWTVANGSLPIGLKLSTSGVISGTPKYESDFERFTVTETDTAKPADVVSRVYMIYTNVIVITNSPTLKTAKAGQYYSVTFTSSSGVAPYAWSDFGTPPPGLTMSKYGVLSGKPTTAGDYDFGIEVQDASGNTAFLVVSLTVT